MSLRYNQLTASGSRIQDERLYITSASSIDELCVMMARDDDPDVDGQWIECKNPMEVWN